MPGCEMMLSLPRRGKPRKDRISMHIAKFGRYLTLAATFVLSSTLCLAAGNGVDSYSAQQLKQMGQQMRHQAEQSGGTVAKILNKYPGSSTMLVFRDKTGQSELHQNMADVIVVLEGQGVLISGGSMVNGKTSAPNEVRGDGVQGGTRVAMKVGDILHVPAGIPHQVILEPGNSILYFAAKVPQQP